MSTRKTLLSISFVALRRIVIATLLIAGGVFSGYAHEAHAFVVPPDMNRSHVLVLNPQGELFAWGNNEYGQVGDRTRITRFEPRRIGTDTWAAASAGPIHSLAINSRGELFAWGNNYRQQLGDGTRGQRRTPVRIGAARSSWIAISAGYRHSLAVNSSGELFAWGANNDGQLGDGTLTQRRTPRRIGTASNWRTVSAGRNFSLAINSRGRLFAWGDNEGGQLGDGTLNGRRATPRRIGTASDWVTVTAGSNHALAINSRGQLFAWGANRNGQLGDGTRTERRAPRRIGTASNWTTVSAGA
ncbi:MAG: hypothetical protein FWD93_01850, partial [Coriobacteriia bacterium]|nr:hypothetical protein [Coriobacteriia bacterium]